MGRVKGGWAGEWQVLRSAPLSMMLMDVEQQLKNTWKREWRKAISGDPEKRVRDHMSDPEVQKRVKLYDTASFALGVFMVMFSEFLLLVHPTVFPVFYLLTYSTLIFIRYLTYHAVKNHYFLIDFCYLLNTSTILQSFFCYPLDDSGICSNWFKANFVLSHGPIAMAILTWQNSLVFHSIDKMTSFFIHIMPTLLCYIQRWNVIPDVVSEDGLSLSLWSAFIVPITLYIVWQAAYFYVQVTVIDKDPELVTSLRYLTQCPSNPMYILVRDVCIKLGIFRKDETYIPDSNKTKAIFMGGQLVYVVVCLIPMPLFFYFRFLNTSYLVLMMLAATWRGGSYYVFHFTKIYHKKFQADKSE